MDFDVSAFVKERDAALLSGDIAECKKYWKKWNPGLKFPNDMVAEMGMHKAITACLSLPLEFRKQSKAWLSERGYTSMDDGDL